MPCVLAVTNANHFLLFLNVLHLLKRNRNLERVDVKFWASDHCNVILHGIVQNHEHLST